MDGSCHFFGPEVRDVVLVVVAYFMAPGKQKDKTARNFEVIHYPRL